MSLLTLVRHGQASFFQEDYDQLSPLGEQQARLLGEHWVRQGVRFDEIAVLVRAPQHYIGLIEHALRRARVPAWFSRGTRRPLTAGRAFLALLACASEQLSASRFAEYLSFAQVPLDSDKQDKTWTASQDEAFGRVQSPAEEDGDSNSESRVPNPESDSILAGTLRAPWRWEALIVDAAVIGRDATRWKRRLEGKHAELERQIREAKREDGGDEAKDAGIDASSKADRRHEQTDGSEGDGKPGGKRHGSEPMLARGGAEHDWQNRQHARG